MAYKSSSRGTRPIRIITLHTAEGSRTARALGAYFWQDGVDVSSHVGIDSTEILQYVPYDRAAWTLRSGNPISDNAEMCAFARWTPSQWLSTDTVDGCINPRGIVRNAAVWAGSRAVARGIPLQRLTPVQVAEGAWGLIDHYAWTVGMRDGTHTDVGGSFPWDVFMADLHESLHPHHQTYTDEEDVMYFVQGGTKIEDADIYGLFGPYLQGLTGESRKDAIAAINSRGAQYKWATKEEIADLDRRSHALLDRGPLFDALNATNQKLDTLITLLTPPSS
jgi:hypothetical protein